MWSLMKSALLTFAILPAPTMPLAHLPAAEPVSLAALDKAFVCPESLASDDARAAALRSFFNTYARIKPTATPPEIIEYRQILLAKHGCTTTLRNTAAAADAIANGEVRDQPWVPVDNREGVSLAMSATHVIPVFDPRFPGDKAVETFAKLAFNAAATTNATHVRYDEVISRTIYYCRSRRYALVENNYFLGGRAVLASPGTVVGKVAGKAPLYEVTAIPGGSFNAEAADWACSSSKAAAS